MADDATGAGTDESRFVYVGKKTAKIFVAGHRGLVGSAIVRKLRESGFTNLLLRTHSELDLTNQSDVESFFATEKPAYVILAAAKVGGIHANNTYPAYFKDLTTDLSWECAINFVSAQQEQEH
ncbi:hypothetical protein DY000_02055031 [Brassica cretica]|uniref:NAD-dependent epimerase/dehydratase domain-containing protein n=1 Tax=Brassica cretica TaxID=69181 RepID=A0ABQ7A863_BRACR|nr:hypothetical protein DY000_02055031 [Brassica cretica]